MRHCLGSCWALVLIAFSAAGAPRAAAEDPATEDHAAEAPASTSRVVEVESVVINLIAQAEVPAEEAGTLVKVIASEGRRVQAGAPLARIDDRDAALEVARAQIALEHATQQAANDVKLRLARQSLKLAELELKKAEEANQELDRVYSPSQIEKLKIELEKARLEVELQQKDLAAADRAVKAAENELLIARRGVERRAVVAPIDGVVVDVRRQIGEWLQPGDTVVRMVRDDRLRAEGFVHVDKLTAPLVGQPVELFVDLPGVGRTAFEGTVTFVATEANPVNGQVRLWAEVDNRQGRLRPGMSADMLVRPGGDPKPGDRGLDTASNEP
jgi:multidrug efflux pump subunit AcrA (membrane-fusion protein)